MAPGRCADARGAGDVAAGVQQQGARAELQHVRGEDGEVRRRTDSISIPLYVPVMQERVRHAFEKFKWEDLGRGNSVTWSECGIIDFLAAFMEV